MRIDINELACIFVLASIVTVGCSSDSNSGKTGNAGTGGTATGGSSSVSSLGGSGTGGTASSSTAVGSVTTLSGTKTLDSLTATEASQLCTDIYAYYGRAIPRSLVCKASGLTYGVSSSAPTDALLQQNCATQEATCLQATTTNSKCGALPSPCTATVEEYSACIADTAAAYKQSVSALIGCATVTHSDLAGVWTFITGAPPASCAALDLTCSGLDMPLPN